MPSTLIVGLSRPRSAVPVNASPNFAYLAYHDARLVALATQAEQYFAARGVAAIQCWLMKHHAYQPVLAGLGYLDAHRPTGFMLGWGRVGPDELSFLSDPHARIHLAHGDSDLV